MKNEYLSYNALQLAAETSFIKWIKEEDASHAVSWKEWMQAHPEMEAVVEEARQIVQANLLAVQPLSHTIDTKALWNRIDKSLSEQAPPAKVRSLRPIYISLAIAAAIALFLLIRPFSASKVELRSPNGEHIAFTLPDFSSIELNAGSSLEFKEKGFAKNREVFLTGEAFFEVEKGDNFIVNTELGSVKVLGTSFNVYEREGNFEVQCLTGKVQVSTANKEEQVILIPGQVAKLDGAGTLIKQDIELLKLATWRKNEFHYVQTPLIDVLEEVKRQYNVEIELRAGNPDEKIKADFSVDNLEVTLHGILWPLHLKHEIKGKKVLITQEE